MSAAAAPFLLFLFIVCAAFVPAGIWYRAFVGLELLGLWFYWLWRERRGYRVQVVRKNLLNFLPGHALLLLGVGLVGSRWGIALWPVIPPLAVGIDLAAHHAPRSIVAILYAILWVVVFALIHRMVAVGKGLAGTALYLWSAVIACVALAYIGTGLYRIIRSEVR